MGIFSAIKYLIILIIIVGLGFAGWNIMNLKADLATSEANNQLLKDGLAEQAAAIKQKEQEVADIQKKTKELEVENEKRRADVSALTTKFDKRDFGKLAEEKPELVEKLINRGTKNALRCFELASGAPLTEEEKKAENPREANRECPSLINPAFSTVN